MSPAVKADMWEIGASGQVAKHGRGSVRSRKAGNSGPLEKASFFPTDESLQFTATAHVVQKLP